MIHAIAIDDELPALEVIEAHCMNSTEVKLDAVFTKPHDAEKYLKRFPVDVVFLDINMPSISGLKLAKFLPPQCLVIFTTAYAEFAAESYELNAIDYLLKPINKSRFDKALLKAKEYLNYLKNKETNDHQYLFIRADYAIHKISVTDILYIEGVGDYVKIFIKEKKTIVARVTMKEILNKLSNDFIRVHRSYIIPLSRIEYVKGRSVKLPEIEISIGITFFDHFLASFQSKPD